MAGSDTAKLLEVAEHALDAVAILVAARVAWEGLTAIELGRDDRQHANGGNNALTIATENSVGAGQSDTCVHRRDDSDDEISYDSRSCSLHASLRLKPVSDWKSEGFLSESGLEIWPR